MTASALYTGRVRHRRSHPTDHAFCYGLTLAYLDLGELPELFRGRWFWSARRCAPGWFRRADYHGPSDRPLADCVRDTVARQLGRRPEGPIRLLTQMRTVGFLFNPVSFYYCFDAATGALDAVLAEITNTPWGERYSYALDVRRSHDDLRSTTPLPRFSFPKRFHVSPFFDMDYTYDWTLGLPDERLFVHMENRRADGRHFHATLTMKRRPLNGRSLAGLLLRHPLQPLKVVTAIYWQALRLWLKRVPFFTHPSKRRPAKEAV